MRRLTLIAAIAVLALAGCGGDDEKARERQRLVEQLLELLRAARTSRSPPIQRRAEVRQERAQRQGRQGHDHDGQPVRHAAQRRDRRQRRRGAGKTVGKGEKSVASADLKAGEYDFYCAVGNHRAEGMEGKLTVK